MKRIEVRWMGVGLLALATAAGYAQAPAGAPAGANGICKDGTYSTAASKSGACRGHKGVQTWYVATPTASATTAKTAAMPAPTATTATAAKPAPTPAASVPAKAAPAAAPAPAASPATATAGPAKKQGPAAAAAAKTAAPGGGPSLVWVNTESNVYHCYGDTYYGKTKAGAYMSEADAKAKGAHGERGKTCSK